MFFAIVFTIFAMFCCLVAYAAITFRRFLAFVIGPPRWEAFDHAAEMEEVIQCFTGQRSIQVDEMRFGDSVDDEPKPDPGPLKPTTNVAPMSARKIMPLGSLN
jgi:hypothetical protein